MTGVSQQELKIDRTLAAPRAEVWKYFTEPEHLSKWWGPPTMHTPQENITIDLRPGGTYTITMVDEEGGEARSSMSIDELRAPELIVFGLGDGEGQVTMELVDKGEQTLLTSVFRGEAPAEALADLEAASKYQLDKLKSLFVQ